jgi:hypothetical protein
VPYEYSNTNPAAIREGNTIYRTILEAHGKNVPSELTEDATTQDDAALDALADKLIGRIAARQGESAGTTAEA